MLHVKVVESPMVFVEDGTFRMGSDDSEAFYDEKPVHNVTLSSYYIGKYEVSQELWVSILVPSSSFDKHNKTFC